jgi:DNA invertase Pin-like site-specific DNA recombinase
MVFRLLSAINEFEKDQLSERTRSAMAHLRQQNRRISAKIPLGYDLAQDGATLVPNALEQALIARIAAWRGRGWSMGKIARKLEVQAIPTKNKARWYRATVRRILARQARLAGSAP